MNFGLKKEDGIFEEKELPTQSINTCNYNIHAEQYYFYES